ncbi:retinal pigment epithelial membrane protein-domain-containing protein [Paraphysoderma sedebokerense]|nr:retinal pigment epithelial membrane protein-domain-containing protein [Paraphysoderma sedebokerense]
MPSPSPISNTAVVDTKAACDGGNNLRHEPLPVKKADNMTFHPVDDNVISTTLDDLSDCSSNDGLFIDYGTLSSEQRDLYEAHLQSRNSGPNSHPSLQRSMSATLLSDIITRRKSVNQMRKSSRSVDSLSAVRGSILADRGERSTAPDQDVRAAPPTSRKSVAGKVEDTPAYFSKLSSEKQSASESLLFNSPAGSSVDEHSSRPGSVTTSSSDLTHQTTGSDTAIGSYVDANEYSDGYLLGFTNTEEVIVPVELKVTGYIPPWVKGVFYRCGPGKFSVETELKDGETGQNKIVDIDHWFDGLCLLHRFEIHDGGKVSYRSRFTSDSQEEILRKTGMMPLSFAQQRDPCKSMFMKFFTIKLDVPREFNVNVAATPVFPLADNSKIDSKKYREILLAKTDANILQEIDLITLEPKGYLTYTDINPKFKGVLTSAHELYDPETGEYINYLQRPGPYIKTSVFSVSRENPRGEIITSLKSLSAPYMHSFGMTKKYIILIYCPYFWKYGGLPILFSKNVYSALYWDGSQPVYFNVISRASKTLVATYEADPFFVFHVINAFDDPNTDDIIIDTCAYRDPLNIQQMYLDKFRNGTTDFEQSHIRRYRLANISDAANLGVFSKRPRATYDIISKPGPELPKINPKYQFIPYRYAYCVIASERMPFEALAKYDLDERTSIEWRQHNCFPSEAIFVPDPKGENEDDGVVLSVVLDGSCAKSFLLVLDATTFKEIGRAEMPDGKIVPFGFHGSYLDHNK